MTDDDHEEAIGAVLASDRRHAVLADVAEYGPTRPMDVSDRTDVPQPSVSWALSDLRDRGLVVLVADHPQAKVYDVTDDGEDVLAAAERMGDCDRRQHDLPGVRQYRQQ